MMKKIGICACYSTKNYGSMLQSYATQRVIESFGYISEYIVYSKKKSVCFLIKQIPRCFNKNLVSDKMLVLNKKWTMRKYSDIRVKEKIREKAFERFQSTYYGSFSPEYYGYDALCKGALNYDSVVVGSDQLWTPGGLASNFYNLKFVPENINKISYATSFGVSKIPWYQKRRTRSYLKRINYLSVRELQGAQIIKEIAGLSAKVVVDPTLLLTCDEWKQAIPQRKLIREAYIFCYFLGKNPKHRELAEELKKHTGIKIVCTPHLDSFVKRDLLFGDEQLFDIGPDDFVNLIRNADYIITDSFHGTVFSIIFHKQFITLNRYENIEQSRNSRIDSLFDILRLEKRRYKSNICEQIKQSIDYFEVDKRILELRKESLNYLACALKGK